jgi:hypothetical protein
MVVKQKLSDKVAITVGTGVFYSRTNQELTLTENQVVGYSPQSNQGQVWYQPTLMVNTIKIDQTRWLAQFSLGAQYHPWKASGFYLQAGSTVYYQVGLQEKVLSNGQEISNAQSQMRFGTTAEQALNIGFRAGFGYGLKVSGKHQILVEPEYRFMLNSFNFGNSLIKSQPQLFGVGLKYFW